MASSKVVCSFKGCLQDFDSEKAMRAHKMYDPKHEYCAKCNMDFGDRTEYYIHRIMSNKHFMCPICTVEFRSSTGREIHIQNNHKRDQNIICTGCKSSFKSAAGLIIHIERNECDGITFARLTQEQARRSLINATLKKDPKAAVPPAPWASSTATNTDDQDGGVRLNIDTAISEALASQPQLPGSASEDDAATLSQQHWPALTPMKAEPKSKPKPAGQTFTLPIRSAKPALALEPVTTDPFTFTLPIRSGKLDHANEPVTKTSVNLPTDPLATTKEEQDEPLTPSLPTGPDDLISFDDDPVPAKGGNTVFGTNRRAVREGTFGIGDIHPISLILDKNARWDASKFFNKEIGRYICNCGHAFARKDDFETHIVTERENRERDVYAFFLSPLTPVCFFIYFKNLDELTDMQLPQMPQDLQLHLRPHRPHGIRPFPLRHARIRRFRTCPR
ncbi:C2H2 finger domain protein [Penicillium lagena]|uniref:C2H2 finger domain protein n=1 Tax=Penicillium lagena TaxID=94218 RepID=UPI0025425EFB|nr:C2H2 finger domain protein [Penicillium lagena]KAJ5611051.1 C2H2 finger domain protein [Penicillium lagena]